MPHYIPSPEQIVTANDDLQQLPDDLRHKYLRVLHLSGTHPTTIHDAFILGALSVPTKKKVIRRRRWSKQ